MLTLQQHLCKRAPCFQLTSAACVAWNCKITLPSCREQKLSNQHFTTENRAISKFSLTVSFFFFFFQLNSHMLDADVTAPAVGTSAHLCPPPVLSSQVERQRTDSISSVACWPKYYRLNTANNMWRLFSKTDKWSRIGSNFQTVYE